MAFKFSHLNVLLILLWLSLLLFLFHHQYFINNNSQKQFAEESLASHDHSLIIRGRGRKTLAIKFDFSPILKHHHHREEDSSEIDPAAREIDPRYGVDKRKVPTGPNPLHH
ncbi:CLAVATA3/ESR (CLE)-related protein 12-like [Neltuma alba]|uniref:CLAVATA3/ESR (CLE)-related protein 12-like n=1 Tax=Neltuma alba TaxID=207710 RepID=UPI0010A2EAB8|nr:CLAVATA3/ESR (CLE)-related protein 12-like [Prosopis alba]